MAVYRWKKKAVVALHQWESIDFESSAGGRKYPWANPEPCSTVL